MSLSLKSLIGKLNETTRKALESAAGLCVTRTHYDVEMEHFLLKLLDETGADSTRIYERFGVDVSRLSAELTRSLDRLRTGNARFQIARHTGCAGSGFGAFVVTRFAHRVPSHRPGTKGNLCPQSRAQHSVDSFGCQARKTEPKCLIYR